MKEEESAKARAIQEMFGSIAARYDFLNHFLSLNVDRHWRRACVRGVASRLTIREPSVLDIGCGTADLSIAFARLGPVAACDFSYPMLRIGRAKVEAEKTDNPVRLLAADALCLPFANAAFDVVASAFVLRNLANIGRGLEEMRRVLRPGGVAGILEFGLPRAPLLGWFYRLYFSRVLPHVGKAVSGIDGPYKYLPDSVRRFPTPEELSEILERCGFCEVGFRRLTGGIAILLTGRVL